MLTMSVQPIDQDIAVIINDNLSPKAQSAMLAQAAREELAAAKAINEDALGREVPYTTTVDGVVDASEDRVRPEGTIVYEFEILTGAFAWILEQLIAHSPVKTGRYEKSHIFLADGEEADVNSPPQDASEYVFESTVPYARKIERADGVYQAVAALASARFDNLAKIEFAYRPATTGAIEEWAKTTTGEHFKTAKSRRQLRKPHAIEWLTSQPAIVITMQQ